MTDPTRAALEQAAHELDIAENALLCSSFHNAASRAKQAAMTARAALSQPEPEGPTDEELYELWEADGEGDFQECRSFARDVLARWGRPTPPPPPQPVPVSERLPGPGDCDAEGLCWVWNTTAYTWGLFRLDLTAHSHWLPAHALPLPGEVEG